MLKLSHATLYTISGLVWFVIGGMLLNLGLGLLKDVIYHPELGSSFFSWFSALCNGPDNAVVALIAVSLAIGFAKGRFVLQKAAVKTYARIRELDNPVSIAKLYTPGNYLIIAIMMGLGMLMKAVGMPFDIRGAIDTAVGAALMQGAVAYFQYAAFSKKASAS